LRYGGPRVIAIDIPWYLDEPEPTANKPSRIGVAQRFRTKRPQLLPSFPVRVRPRGSIFHDAIDGVSISGD